MRIAKPVDPERIAELKKKIRDVRYVDDAVQNLAQRLTNELVGQERKK